MGDSGRTAARTDAPQLAPTTSAEAADVAHVLRRLTFGPFPGTVAAAMRDHGNARAALEALLAGPALAFDPPDGVDAPFDPHSEDRLGAAVLLKWWIARMSSDRAGLHERMMWFWHTHFTSSAEKCTFVLLWRQLRTLHTHALGNFAELTKAICIDPAMLQYLDGAASSFQSPNENFGRELMELYTMGRGHYTEEDVRAAAHAFSGWSFDFVGNRVTFTPSIGPTGPITFLGRTADFGAMTAVDQIMEQPSVAPFIVRKLWHAFIGGEVDDAQVTAWADSFRADYEIRPLVEQMLRSDAFARSHLSRPRTGIEWFCASNRAAEMDDPDVWTVADFGQLPYYPPNVAGWPDPSQWTSSSSLFARAAHLSKFVREIDVDGGRALSVVEALERCGIYEVSDSTRAAMEQLPTSGRGVGARNAMLVKAALMSPEFALS